MRRIGVTAFAALMLSCCPGAAENIGAHKIILPQDITWGPAPSGVSAAVQSAPLFGDPKSAGPFAIRLKLTKGVTIPPHMHRTPEALTVISGELRLGLGKAADRTGATPMPAGSFAVMPQGVLHYAFADQETIVQINGDGPWSIDYADPKDDPRLQIAPEPLLQH